MHESNPYSTTRVVADDPSASESASVRRMWLAFGIAPPAGPIVTAVCVFVVGLLFQSLTPDSVNINPMSLIFAPLLIIVLGIPLTYLICGLVGMPILFWLRRRDRLNLFTTLGTSLFLIFFLAVAVGVITTLSTTPGNVSRPQAGVTAAGMAVLLMTPFAMLSGTIFWWIGVRFRRPAAGESEAARP